MLLSHHKQFIYFHIPQTGGSSLTWLFRDVLATRKPLLQTDDRIPGWQDCYHYDGKQHSGFRDNKRLVNAHPGYFRFAFVRNPWDLALSWYTALSRRTHDEHLETETFNPKKFKQFLRQNLFPRSPKDWLMRLGKDRGYHLLMSRAQADYVTDRRSRVQLDFVGRFERYDEDMAVLLNRLGATPTDQIKINQSHHGRLDYRDFYDRESRDWIAQRYRKDIELFGYGF